MCANIWKENTGFVNVSVQKLSEGVVGGGCLCRYKEGKSPGKLQS